MKAIVLVALLVIVTVSAAPLIVQKDVDQQKDDTKKIPIILALPMTLAEVQKMKHENTHKEEKPKEGKPTDVSESYKSSSLAVKNKIKGVAGSIVVAIDGSIIYELDGFYK